MKTSKLRIQLIPPKPLLAKEGIKGRSGFTLIEVAIVLIVIGILLTIGISLIGPLTKQTKVIDTREAVKNARASLLGYAVKYGYLPASPDPSPSGARRLDAWGRNLNYYVATSLDGTGNACGIITTNITVLECTPPACATPNQKDNIAFIVYSNGEDAEGTGTATQPTGAPACPLGKTCYWIREQVSSYTVGPATYYYDDIVQYATLDEIRSARGCSQQLTITSSTTLPTGVEDNFYSYQMQATGGITPYTWSVSGQTINTLGCSGNSYPLTNPNTDGFCLYTTGLLSGTINKNAATNTGDLTSCSATIAVPNTVTVTDSALPTNATATFTAGGTVPVNPQPMTITTQSLPDAKTGVSYNVTGAQFQGTGGNSATDAWSMIAGALPAGMTLNAAGLLSGTPTAAGTFPFTVQLADTCTPSNSTSNAFTLNVIDSCFASGINFVNTSGASRYFKRNDNTTGATGCSTAWANNANLNSHPSATGGIQPYDTYYFFSNAGCTTRVCTTTYPALGAISYSTAQSLDSNKNCQVRATLTGVTCTFTDL